MERLIRALVTHFPHPADTTNAAAAGAGGGAGAGAGAGAAASSTRTAVDLIVSARWVVCVEPSGVLDHHSVVVKDRRIVEVLPTADALAKYDAAETVNKPCEVLEQQQPISYRIHTLVLSRRILASMSCCRASSTATPTPLWCTCRGFLMTSHSSSGSRKLH